MEMFAWFRPKYNSMAVCIMAVFFGCTHSNVPGEYRESQGTVTRFSTNQTDPVLRITEFLKLKNGTIIYPTYFFYHIQKTSTGTRRVEKIARTFQSITPKGKNFLYLPTANEIAIYYFLVRKSYPVEVQINEVTKTEYRWTDWHLWELKADDLPKNKQLTFPAFEKICRKELTELQQQIQVELIQKYEKIEAAAWKAAGTPVGPKGRGGLGDREPAKPKF